MDDDKYTRNIILLCPTCGESDFETDDTTDYEPDHLRCKICGRETTKEELIKENGESIDEHKREIGEQAKRDIAKRLKNKLKR